MNSLSSWRLCLMYSVRLSLLSSLARYTFPSVNQRSANNYCRVGRYARRRRKVAWRWLTSLDTVGRHKWNVHSFRETFACRQSTLRCWRTKRRPKRRPSLKGKRSADWRRWRSRRRKLVLAAETGRQRQVESDRDTWYIQCICACIERNLQTRVGKELEFRLIKNKRGENNWCVFIVSSKYTILTSC